MEIKFVGTGGAFDYQYRNSAALVTMNQRRILVDSGNSIYFTLREKNAIDNIDAILITHLHDDHVGSLSSVILHHNIYLKHKLEILYPTREFKDRLRAFLAFSLQNPDEYVKFRNIDEIEDIEYIETTGLHVETMQTFGYIFKDGGKAWGYSGDLGDPDIIFSTLKERGFQNATVFHEIFFHQRIKSHSYYKDLERHLGDFTIYGYHCDPKQNPEDNKIPLVYNSPEWML